MLNGYFSEEDRRRYILDGGSFDDMEGFYRAAAALLTQGLSWQPGNSLDAFNDLLRGGFGMHGYGEPITIEWRNFRKSRRELGDTAVLNIISVILDCDESGHDCKLELY